jgi:glutaredoxin 3
MAPVKIYTRELCGYCTAAKHLLDGKGVAYEEIDCTGDAATRRWLVEQTGQTTVPQVFIAGKSVGGYSDLRALDEAGELDPLLHAT